MKSFAIPYCVPSQNVRERWHWRRQRKDVTTCEELVYWHSRHIAPAMGRRLVRILSYRRQLITDRANLVGGCKGLIDGLVRAKLLIDDKDRFAAFEYDQRVLSQLPAELVRGARRLPMTVVEVVDL